MKTKVIIDNIGPIGNSAGCHNGCPSGHRCPSGHKGGMGLPGGVYLPNWMITIIDFRNDQLNKEHSIDTDWFKVDASYDKIDAALMEMINTKT